MSLKDSLNIIINHTVDEETLWDAAYKIPWDDPDFSRRMLAEHLSQEHDLTSRKQNMIRKQVQWIHEHICNSTPAKLLDIGCGPGLYIEQFATLDYDCRGIDFSHASIEYSKSQLGNKAKLINGDIRSVDFGGGYGLVMMIYGEFNVFSPSECRKILKKPSMHYRPAGNCCSKLTLSMPLSVSAGHQIAGTNQAPACWDYFQIIRISA